MTDSDRCKFLGTVYAYSPYGQAITLGPDGGNSIQYTGRENDGTGLLFYRARYYDPVLKQWTSEDPIGIAGGINLRQYVNGNPVSLNDPMGELGQIGTAIGIVVAGLGTWKLMEIGTGLLNVSVIESANVESAKRALAAAQKACVRTDNAEACRAQDPLRKQIYQCQVDAAYTMSRAMYGVDDPVPSLPLMPGMRVFPFQ